MEERAADESGDAASTSKVIRRLPLITLSLFGIVAALYLIPSTLEHWHYVLQRLFYFPIVLAGLTYGWRAGGAVAGVASLAYLLRHNDLDLVDRLLDCAVFFLVGGLTGILSERERLQRENLRTTAANLREVYQELQDNVQQLNRAARMSALGQLAAGLAHEIRNPLASIEGAAFVAMNSPGDANGELLRIIGKESGRLNRLLSEFLQFARPRAPHMSVVDGRGLVDSVFSLVAPLATESSVRLVNNVPAAGMSAEGDGEMLKQLLLNLVLNALQAMTDGGIVSVQSHDEPGGCNLLVRDTGPGVPESSVDRIFDPFFSTKPEGTGLGLAIAYQIAQQHGGELRLSDNGPTGATFCLRLPARDMKPVAASPVGAKA